ncbi:tyrosine-type recombinase/integrase [Chryseobacterium sp. SIMBA_028]|uniref:tyrosine-type recombinase/integrase n=1 Tax=Chryseobacterium sp. SIMBA_028 TaxID=3085771 RepID=UPI00397BBD1D
MNFEFFLSKNRINRNIILSISDNHFKTDYKLTTPLMISSEDWDQEKQRPKNIYLKHHKIFNQRLDSLKVNLTEYIHQKISGSKKVTEKKLLEIINKVCSQNNEEYSENDLLHFVNQYINNRKELICYSTYKRYKVFSNLIKRFEGFIKNRININNVNFEFIRNFILFGKDESYSENTIYRTLNFIKTILNYIERRGITTSIREFEFRQEKSQREVITLSEEEITQIKIAEVPEALQNSKEWLLISCYTGQRISDFMNFKIDMLFEINGKLCMNFIQQKTKKKIILPLHPIVLDIIRNNDNNFPKPLNTHLYNGNIKKIAQIAKINFKIKAKKRIGHRVKNLVIEKWEILTSHIGRRSFATNFYGKIPTSLLISATGHATEQMFLNYINPFDKDQIVCLGNHFDEIHKKQSSSTYYNSKKR